MESMELGGSSERAAAIAASPTSSVPPSSPRPFALPELIVVYKPAAGTESDQSVQPVPPEPFGQPQPGAREVDMHAYVEHPPQEMPARTPARKAARRPRGAIAALLRIFGRR